MEDKEVQMALYGVSIAIVTHYEDILLAMKLGKQTEAENTIKNIIPSGIAFKNIAPKKQIT